MSFFFVGVRFFYFCDEWVSNGGDRWDSVACFVPNPNSMRQKTAEKSENNENAAKSRNRTYRLDSVGACVCPLLNHRKRKTWRMTESKRRNKERKPVDST